MIPKTVAECSPYFTLWNAVTGEFDSDWHSTLEAAEAHRERCQLPDGWRVAQLSRDQRAQVYAQ